MLLLSVPELSMSYLALKSDAPELHGADVVPMANGTPHASNTFELDGVPYTGTTDKLQALMTSKLEKHEPFAFQVK